MRRLCFRARRILACSSASVLLYATGCATASHNNPASAPASYTAYVASEASDIVTRIRFVPGGDAVVERLVGVGEPGRIVGPHGVAISPDGRYWYVSLSHGTPNGRVARFTTDRDTLVRRATVGVAPGPVDISPDGQYIFVVNQDATPSNTVAGISILHASTLSEVARPATCARPRNGHVIAARYFTVCETGDQLVAIDTRSFQVTHRFSLAKGQERLLDISDRGTARRNANGCGATSVEPGRGLRSRFVYVACGRTGDVLEIDVLSWQLARRLAVGAAPFELATDLSGTTLLATLRNDSTVVAINLDNGTARTRIVASQPGPHSIAITPDGLYAFISNEGGSRGRGSVDVVEMATLKRVASVPVGYGAGDIAVMQQGTRTR